MYSLYVRAMDGQCNSLKLNDSTTEKSKSETISQNRGFIRVPVCLLAVHRHFPLLERRASVFLLI